MRLAIHLTTNILSNPITLRPVADSKEGVVTERPESRNPVDDAEMDLGVREMDADDVDREADYVPPN
jgi:hypothetical protein